MLTSLIGAIFVWKGFGKLVQHNTHYLITLASGIFTVLVFSLLKETWHLSDSILITVSSVLAGVLLIELIIKFIPTAHHHHSVPAKCGHSHSNIDARRMMWSDFFHNAGDGILLVTSYTVDIYIGIIATLGIFLHEAVQEISEFFVLKEAGYTTKKALLWNFISSGGILLGVILAFSVSSIDWLSAPLMGLAGGGFIYALSKDLIPHTVHHAQRTNTILKHIFIFIFGILLMLAINNIIPHSHENHSHEKELSFEVTSLHLA